MRRQLYILMLLIIGTLVLSVNFISAQQVTLASSRVSAAPRSPSIVNLALNKLATQSSGDVAPASRAVDGNIDGDLFQGSVSHTLWDNHAWWQVDLGTVGLIEKIEIYNRTDSESQRLNNYYVFVSEVPFASTDPEDTKNQPGVWKNYSVFQSIQAASPTTIAVDRPGRYVRVQLSGTDFLHMAEVQVLGHRDVGQWSPKFDLPDIPVHISLLPSGKLLFWGRDKLSDGNDKDGRSDVYLWEPVSNTFTRKDNERTNLFCSGHSFLPNGDLFVAGGSEAPTDTAGKRYDVEGHGPRETYIFDYVNEVWLPGPTMTHGRWYPSLITLSTGETLIVTGDYVDSFTQRTGRPDSPVRLKNQDTEILGLNRTLPRMPNDMLGPLTNYPLLHLGPNGNVLVVSRTAPSDVLSDNDRNGLYYDTFDRKWVEVTNLDLQQHHDMATSVMYDQGKVMVIGGRSTFTEVSKDTEVIDLNQNPWTLPTWSPAAPMNFPRYFHTSVLMPDGKVFTVGGSMCGGANNIRTADGSCTDGAIMNPEIYDPGTDVWSIMARQGFIRMYHSVALLMPDARILVAGGGRPGAVGEIDAYGQRIDKITDLHAKLFAHYEAEIFSPPYLFNADGTQATRPEITSGPPSITYGQSFSVGIGIVPANQIGQVVLVRLPSVTHGLNFDQRRVVLSRAIQGPQTLTVTAPANGNECPPGPYMLFVLGPNRVPSVAKMIFVDNPACNTPLPPSGLVATAISNTAVSITWTAPSGPVHHYELDRKERIWASFTKLIDLPPSATSFTDQNLTPSVAYLYQIRAVCLSGNSSPSNTDLATTIIFTDSPLLAGVTVVKAQHINELRSAVNAVRATAELSPASWTDASLPGVSVKAVHIDELRRKLQHAFHEMGLPIPSFTDDPLIPGLIVRRAHVEEIRQAVR